MSFILDGWNHNYFLLTVDHMQAELDLATVTSQLHLYWLVCCPILPTKPSHLPNNLLSLSPFFCASDPSSTVLLNLSIYPDKIILPLILQIPFFIFWYNNILEWVLTKNIKLWVALSFAKVNHQILNYLIQALHHLSPFNFCTFQSFIEYISYLIYSLKFFMIK